MNVQMKLRKYRDLSDEELEAFLLKEIGGHRPYRERIYWICTNSAISELLKRYNNKKKECEVMRRHRDIWIGNLEKRLEKIHELTSPKLNFLTSFKD